MEAGKSFFLWYELSLMYGSIISETTWLSGEINNIIYMHGSLFYHVNIPFNLISRKVHDNLA